MIAEMNWRSGDNIAILPQLRAALASFSRHVTIDGNDKGRRKAGLSKHCREA
jgi:hypothetical protein